MRIISYNVNGIRAAMNKGFIDWLKTDPGDVICLQETKAVKDQVNHKLFADLGYYDYWQSALKKGYSGVAVFTRIKPDNVIFGNEYTCNIEEGRILQLDFDDIRLINAYFPSGTTGEVRQKFKFQWLDDFHCFLDNARKEKAKLVLCGDYNIAHKAIDIHDPVRNKTTSGFLPGEREWMDQFFSNGWIDAFRQFHPESHRYSWWSQRFPGVRQQNKGWRIDYINVTEKLKKQLVAADIYHDVKYSDHCPVFVEIKTTQK
jgi:exodeoxyribonuclease-3